MTGVFTGVTIGIFFNLTTNTKFDRWVNLNSLEIFPAIIYVIFTLVLLFFFYGIGMFLTWLIDKNRTLSFHLNFVSGVYCSTISFLFVLYHAVSRVRNIIAILGIFIWLIVAHYSIKRKR